MARTPLHSARRLLATGLAVVSIGLLAAAPAGAATLAREAGGFGSATEHYTGGPEANHVTVTSNATTMTFTDPGVTITATAPCTGGVGSGSCPLQVGTGNYATVDGAAGNDNLDLSGLTAQSSIVYDGPGADQVKGTSLGDTLMADPSPTGDSNDVYDGGPAVDQLLYWNRTAAVNLTLDGAANDGSNCPGAGCENDNILTTIENIGGGSSDDVLVGNSQANGLIGCQGNDIEVGGAGDDALADGVLGLCGGGNDNYVPGTGVDTVDDASGIDSVSYAERSNPVSISSDGLADDGENGEGDNIGANIETLIGGDGGDQLIGTALPDTLIGGGGNDTLIGNEGSDSLAGGDGDDVLKMLDGFVDDGSCGAGNDTTDADSLDSLSADCELNYRDGKPVGAPDPITGSCPVLGTATTAKVKSGKLKLSIRNGLSRGSCSGSVTIRAGTKVVGRASFTLTTGQTDVIRIKLSKVAQRALARKRKLKVTVTAIRTDSGASTSKASLLLKPGDRKR